MIKSIMTATEAEPIIHNWIDEAIKVIEAHTGTVLEHDDILYQLADQEWTYSIVIGDEEDEIYMKQAIIQLSYIVERNIDFIIAEREDTDA